MAEAAPAPPYDEVLEFLLSSPSPEAVIAFRPSEETQRRIRDLLEANRQGHLTAEQQFELDEFARIEHLVRMLKIKARQKLAHS
jgi:hypothetical protein